MAWDFSTEPEFERKLEWMRAFVRDAGLAAGDAVVRARLGRTAAGGTSAAGAGQGAGAVGRAPGSRARRPGLRSGQARVDARDPRLQPAGAADVRKRRAGHGQLRDPGDGRHPGAEGALPASAARRRPEVGVQHDRARHRRIGSDDAQDPRRARRRRVGHQRPQVVLVQRLDRRLHDRDGGHRSRCPPPPARLDVRRRRRHAGRQRRPRRGHDGASLRQLRPLRQPRRDPLRGRADPRRRAARGPGRRLPDRPAAPVPGAHPPLHALAGRRPPGLRHALRALAVPRRRTARP